MNCTKRTRSELAVLENMRFGCVNLDLKVEKIVVPQTLKMAELYRMSEIHPPTETQVDPQEFDLPETTFSRDIDNKVFQGIIVQTLSRITGIGLLEGSFLNTLMGRTDRIKGISAEQDLRSKSVKIRMEIRVGYGVSIPKKAEEIQSAVVEEITKMTGVHVSEIHVVFKEILPQETSSQSVESPIPEEVDRGVEEEFEEEFTIQ
jgi:uncharacterized alkaline shock family protein YloU